MAVSVGKDSMSFFVLAVLRTERGGTTKFLAVRDSGTSESPGVEDGRTADDLSAG